MGDNYQVLAFDSIEPEAAQSTVTKAMNWLIAKGVIREDRTDCAYGSEDGFGHKPGPAWRDIVDEAEEQSGWDLWSQGTGKPAPKASEMMGRFLELWINGVEGSGERSVCQPGQNGEPEPKGTCPACHTATAEVPLFDLLGRWWDGEQVDAQCPSCHVASRLEDWDWQPDYAPAQAHITFWNWPHISANAIAQLSAALGGVRIRHIPHGRL